MKINKTFLLVILGTLLSVLYAPVYIAAWFLHIIARLLLSIANLGLLRFQKAKDIFKSLFRFEVFI